MQIPKYDYSTRAWDKYNTFHNHLTGPFYVLDTGELIIDRNAGCSREHLRDFPTLNVSLLGAYKLARGERVNEKFTGFIDPRTSKPIPYTNLICRSGGHQLFLIDYNTELIYGLTTELTENDVPAHIADKKVKGYATSRGIVTGKITLSTPKKYTKEEKAHIKRMVAASKAWVHMDTDVRVKERSKTDVTVYYKNEWMSLMKVNPTRDLFDRGQAKSFNDLTPEIRVHLAYKPLVMEYDQEQRSVLYFKNK